MQLEMNLRETIKSLILKFEFSVAEKTIDEAIAKTTASTPEWFDLEILRAYIEFVKHSLFSREEAFSQLTIAFGKLEDLAQRMKAANYEDGLNWAQYYSGLCKYTQAEAKNDDFSLFKQTDEIWHDVEQKIIEGTDFLLIAELLLSKALLYEQYAKRGEMPAHHDPNVTVEFAIENMLDKVQEQFFKLLLKIGSKEDSELKMRLNYALARVKGLRDEKLGKMQEDLTKSGRIKVDALGSISYYFLTATKYAKDLEAAYFLCAIPLQLCKIISRYIYDSLQFDPPPDLNLRLGIFTQQIRDCLDTCKKYNIAFIAEQAVDLLSTVRDELLKNNIKIQI
ncbi:MAG: hypothetical protein A2Y62_15425 [Candidatus Fischerbacteria bacterium RBG_13_37_8]|uniref:Uncharacterized protein n=1 Tax=Candidatus Fischerbacteria bacterium RBG_13_37_8 TaxID=1817863 RepID=A0A1F5VKS7_9BACT|nr:MAG: hypothetical protein A2Y62_15425 [Candidatus Fischerbacteria bacterium RBG_13_37_8]